MSSAETDDSAEAAASESSESGQERRVLPVEQLYIRERLESDGSEYEPSEDEHVRRDRAKSANVPDRSSYRAQEVIKPESDLSSLEDGTKEAPEPVQRRGRTRKRRISDVSDPQDLPAQQARRLPAENARSYLALLNAEIADCVAVRALSRLGPAQLATTQLGLTIWTGEEKEVFFEALSRRGRDDLPGIAATVGTKTEVEVALYLRLLQDAVHKRRQSMGRLALAGPEGVEAAVELSAPCVAALEGAADALQARMDRKEEAEEIRRWGEDRWLITQSNYRSLEEAADDLDSNMSPRLRTLMHLFRVGTWLRLPRRLFMNASYQEGCWATLSAIDSPPAIRTTALQDFQSLTLALSRKIIVSALWVAQSRIRAREGTRKTVSYVVTRKDIKAAVEILGLNTAGRKGNWRQFWAGAARRLRLDVVDEPAAGDDGDSGVDDAAEPDTMSYEAVESALGLEAAMSGHEFGHDVGHEEVSTSDEGFYIKSESDDTSDAFSSSNDEQQQVSDQSHPEISQQGEHGQESVDDEANELMLFSAVEFPADAAGRRAVRRQIRHERLVEARADQLDMAVSLEEESALWAMLAATPPEGLLASLEKETQTTENVAGTEGRNRRKEYLDVASFYPAAVDWRKETAYVSEWEAEAVGWSDEKDE
jgi:RNA polymerase I-specific transcription initiation factor RRN5